MIKSIGTDLVEISRIKKLLLKKSYLARLFTPKEIKYCLGKSRPAESFAARFAAKEAFLKAIGTGWGTKHSPKWTEIEILNTPSPTMKLSGKAREIVQGYTHLSLAHTQEYALAVVVLESNR